MRKIFYSNVIICPECSADLNTSSAELIQCSNEQCHNQYKIINNVPTFISDTPESGKGFEYQWKKRENGKFEKNTLYGKYREEEYSQFFRHLKITPHDIENKNILDAGCGSARMLQLLSEKHSANYYGIDLSSSLYNA